MVLIFKIRSFYIVHGIKLWPYYVDNEKFGTVKLTKYRDADKYFYFGYDILFDVCGTFPLSNVRIGKNIIIFDANLSSSVYVDNEKKNILNFVKGPKQGLDNTTLSAEAEY